MPTPLQPQPPSSPTQIDHLRMPPLALDREGLLKQLEDPDSRLEFEELSDEQQADPDFVIAALRGEKLSRTDVGSELRADRRVLTAVYQASPYHSLRYGSAELRDDSELMLAAIRSSQADGGEGYLMRFVSPRLKADPDFVRAVVLNSDGEKTEVNSSAFKFASPALRNDEAFVREMVMSGAQDIVTFASAEVRDSKALVEAVREFGRDSILPQMSERVRGDRELVLAEIRATGSVPLHALSSELQEDREVVIAGLARGRENYFDLSEEMQADSGLLLEAVKKSASVYGVLPEELQRQPEFAEPFVRGFGSIRELHPDILANKKFIAKTLRVNSASFHLLPETMRRDPQLILAAAQNDAEILAHVPPEVLAGDPQLQTAIATVNVLSEFELRNAVGDLSPEVQSIYDNTRTAMHLLGFSDVIWSKSASGFSGRMDNSKEIIRNRYAISSEDVRLELKNLLGADFFDGAKARDDRPTILVLMNESDGNRAFAQYNRDFRHNDFIDELTAEYRVLYYETADEDQLREAIAEATLEKKSPVDHLVLGYHGHKSHMALSHESDPNAGPRDFSTEEPQLLDWNDRDMREDFAGSVQSGGKIYLISCSTGEGGAQTPGQIDNMAEFIHGILPETTVYAPIEPVTVPRIVGWHDRKLVPPYLSGYTKEGLPFATFNPARKLEYSSPRLSGGLRSKVQAVLDHAGPQFTLVASTDGTQAELRSWGETIEEYPLAVDKDPAQLLAAQELIKIALIDTLNDPQYTNFWPEWAKDRNFEDPKKLSFDKQLADSIGLGGEMRVNYMQGGAWQIYVDKKLLGELGPGWSNFDIKNISE